MKRFLLIVLGIAALVTASSVFAQSGSGKTNPPGATAPTNQPTPPAGQGDTPSAPTGQTPATDTTAPPAAGTPVQADTGSATSGAAPAAHHATSMPATASNSPLMVVIGIVALLAFTILVVVRRRGAMRT